MENKLRSAEKLIKDINSKITKWDERSQFTIKGVKNLSMSDLGTLQLYAETYIRSNGYGFPGLMKPRGDIAKVLESYGLKDSYSYGF